MGMFMRQGFYLAFVYIYLLHSISIIRCEGRKKDLNAFIYCPSKHCNSIFGGIDETTTTTTTTPTTRTTTTLSSSKSVGIERPPNEFSRPINVDAVLGRGGRTSRDYSVTVEAEAEELDALRKRFHLPNIHSLKGDLTLKQDSPGRRRTGTAGNSEDTLFVVGNISSNVTQTCVRTNDDFDVEMNLEVNVAVRSIRMRDRDSLLLGLVDMEEEEEEGISKSKSSNYQSRRQGGQGGQGGGGGRKNMKAKPNRRNLDDMGLMELQNLMTDMDYYEDDDNDVIEDDAVYQDGILDAGELVSQMFRLKLDPYPKKPGSKPVKISFSG